MSCCPYQADECSPRVLACCCQPRSRTLLQHARGPYPDEVIMEALDRILYYSGATKIFHWFGLGAMGTALPGGSPAPTPSLPCLKASDTSICNVMGKSCSKTSLSKYASVKSSTYRPISICCQPGAMSSSMRSKCTIPKCGTPISVTPKCCTPKCGPPISLTPKCGTAKIPRPRTPRVDFAHPVSDNRQPAGGLSMSDRMKYSLSTASLAYSRLKTKLSTNLPGQKWLWTRLVSSDDGCHVYEVYKNSDVDQAPHHMAGAKEPVILFLVMPNGYVMPFESLSSY